MKNHLLIVAISVAIFLSSYYLYTDVIKPDVVKYINTKKFCKFWNKEHKTFLCNEMKYQLHKKYHLLFTPDVAKEHKDFLVSTFENKFITYNGTYYLHDSITCSYYEYVHNNTMCIKDVSRDSSVYNYTTICKLQHNHPLTVCGRILL